MNLIFVVVAIVLFVLVGLGTTVGHVDAVRLIAWGLASLAASMVPWPGWPNR